MEHSWVHYIYSVPMRYTVSEPFEISELSTVLGISPFTVFAPFSVDLNLISLLIHFSNSSIEFLFLAQLQNLQQATTLSDV